MTTNYSWIYKVVNPDEETKMLLQKAAEYRRDYNNAKWKAEETQIEADICHLALKALETEIANVLEQKQIDEVRRNS